MNRQVLSGTTNQIIDAYIYCDFNGVRYTSMIAAGRWQIIIPRTAMVGQPEETEFKVIMENAAQDRLILRQKARSPLPATPANLQVSHGGGSLTAMWERPDRRGRIIQYQLLHNGKQKLLGNANKLYIPDVPVGVEQIIQVRSVDDIGRFSIPATVRTTLRPSQAPKVVTNLDGMTLVDASSLLITWTDTRPRQWETIIRAWQEYPRQWIENSKVLAGTNQFTLTGYETDKPLTIQIINVPVAADGNGPDYKNQLRYGVQTFSMDAKF